MKKKNYIIINTLSLLIICVPTTMVQAEIYKCVDSSGKVFYADKSCPEGNVETELRAIKDPKNGYIPPEFVPDVINGKQTGIVVGNNQQKINKKEIDGEASASENMGGSQDSSGSNNLSQGDNSESAESELANNQTGGDKLFNKQLKESPQNSSSAGNELKLLGDLLTLEPPGKEI